MLYEPKLPERKGYKQPKGSRNKPKDPISIYIIYFSKKEKDDIALIIQL
jgi:hypothetical protein